MASAADGDLGVWTVVRSGSGPRDYVVKCRGRAAFDLDQPVRRPRAW
jgi:hypothetical protein